jgi:hypothetical protein
LVTENNSVTGVKTMFQVMVTEEIVTERRS